MSLRNLVTVLATLFVSGATAVDNGLAITPQMGCKWDIKSIEAHTDENQGIIGMLWDATSQKTSYSKQQN